MRVAMMPAGINLCLEVNNHSLKRMHEGNPLGIIRDALTAFGRFRLRLGPLSGVLILRTDIAQSFLQAGYVHQALAFSETTLAPEALAISTCRCAAHASNACRFSVA